jgi:hypothetical protein
MQKKLERTVGSSKIYITVSVSVEVPSEHILR